MLNNSVAEKEQNNYNFLFYNCCVCQKPVIMHSNLFGKGTESLASNSNYRGIGKKSEYRVTLTKKDSIDCDYSQNISDFSNELSALEIDGFPFCPNCCIFLSQRILSIAKMYEKAEDELKLLASKKIPSIMDIPKQLIKGINDQIEVMKDVISVFPHNNPYSSPSPEEIFIPDYAWKPVNDYSLTNPNIIICSTFYIGHNSHYGTINNIRIGVSSPDPVPKEELNAGLIMIGHLVQVLGQYLEKPNLNIEIGLELFLFENNEDPLPLTFKSNDTKKVSSFNLALTRLFQAVLQLYSLNGTYDPVFTPPFSISIQNRQINGIKFEYDPLHPCLWAEPMKFLLLNLKSIQTRVAAYRK